MHTANFKFDKVRGRDAASQEQIRRIAPDYDDYFLCKDKILPKIKSIVANIDQQPPRVVGEGHGGYL